MPIAIQTSKQPWLRRPSRVAQINWASPLARGLVSAWRWPNRIDCVRGLTTSSTIQPTVTPLGPAHSVGGSRGLAYGSDTFPKDSGSISLWVRINFASIDGLTFQQFFDSDGTRHAFFMNGSNVLQMYIDGRIRDFNVSWAASDVVHLAFVWNKSSDTQSLYVNGLAQSARTGPSGTWGSTALGSNIYWFQRYTSNQQPNADGVDGSIWSRALSPDEVWFLYAPRTRWSLYRRDVARVVVDYGASAGGAFSAWWAARRTGRIGTGVM